MDQSLGSRSPVRALSVIFKGMLREQIKKQFPNLKLPRQTWRKKWRVYCKPAPQDPADVIDYLARYVHRVAITDRNILSVTDSSVTFGYWNGDKNEYKTMSLLPERFIHRFLQHVLPKGIQKVRYFGLWHPSKRDVLRRLILILPPEPNSQEQDQQDACISWENAVCPRCKTGRLCLLGIVRNKEPP